MEISMISHSGKADGKRGKSKHTLPSVRILDDELGLGIVEYDRQWSVFTLRDLILWGMSHKRGPVTEKSTEEQNRDSKSEQSECE
jgi:hypothetical protein